MKHGTGGSQRVELLRICRTLLRFSLARLSPDDITFAMVKRGSYAIVTGIQLHVSAPVPTIFPFHGRIGFETARIANNHCSRASVSGARQPDTASCTRRLCHPRHDCQRIDIAVDNKNCIAERTPVLGHRSVAATI